MTPLEINKDIEIEFTKVGDFLRRPKPRGPQEVMIKYFPIIDLRFSNERAVEEVLTIIRKLEYFFHLMQNRCTYLEQVVFLNEKGDECVIVDQAKPQDVSIKNESEEFWDPKTINWYTDVESTSLMLKNWLSFSDDIFPILSFYRRTKYSAGFIESRLVDVCQLLEQTFLMFFGKKPIIYKRNFEKNIFPVLCNSIENIVSKEELDAFKENLRFINKISMKDMIFAIIESFNFKINSLKKGVRKRENKEILCVVSRIVKARNLITHKQSLVESHDENEVNHKYICVLLEIFELYLLNMVGCSEKQLSERVSLGYIRFLLFDYGLFEDVKEKLIEIV